MTIAILGGGISALSFAWSLQRQNPGAKLVLFEKENRLGGLIETGPFQFEKGPRTFPVAKSEALLSLIEEVGLKEEILFSAPQADCRFLWHRGKLRSPSFLWPRLLPACFREPFRPKGSSDDESIYEFALRRFDARVAETVFDPLALGVFGGDIRTLSLRSSFPSLYAMEQEHGSVVRAWLKKKNRPRQKGLFTLKRGMGSLIEALEKQLHIQIVRGSQVDAVAPHGVFAKGKFWSADWIVSALPGCVLGDLTGLWPDFPAASLWVVNAAFQHNVFPKSGFGYLVPTQENESLLGMIWDSAIFPQQNQEKLCRLTAMIRPASSHAAWAEGVLFEAVKRHLGNCSNPLFVQAQFMNQAIPQFHVGYAKRLEQFKRELFEKFPRLIPVGNYLGDLSVNGCIQLAKTAASKIISTN